MVKDARAHCYCASLVRTPFTGRELATSFLSACTESKTQQNIELMFKNGIGVFRRCHEIYGYGLPLTLVIFLQTFRLMLKPSSVI